MEQHGFSEKELTRYARQLILPDFDLEAQARLRAASILVVGAGGLGAPLLLYLAAAGVGRIGIIDPDVISESNLHRQVLYTTPELGQLKAQVARERLSLLNPHIQVDAFPTSLNPDNALDLIASFDLVADGSDNFSTRYLVNDACVILDKPNVFASVFRYEGQVAVFNAQRADGSRGPNYRDLFPTPPPAGQIPNCAEAGVMGVLPGIIGSLQANEALKLITGLGEPLDGRLLTFDAATTTQQILKLPARPENRPTRLQLEDYDRWCENALETVPEINAATLKSWLEQNPDLQLVDIREHRERQSSHIGGSHIPMAELPARIDQLRKDQPLVLYCHSGLRSETAVRQLYTDFGFRQILHLTGGILAWQRTFGSGLAAKT